MLFFFYLGSLSWRSRDDVSPGQCSAATHAGTQTVTLFAKIDSARFAQISSTFSSSSSSPSYLSACEKVVSPCSHHQFLEHMCVTVQTHHMRWLECPQSSVIACSPLAWLRSVGSERPHGPQKQQHAATAQRSRSITEQENMAALTAQVHQLTQWVGDLQQRFAAQQQQQQPQQQKFLAALKCA